jgi:putative redox protein
MITVTRIRPDGTAHRLVVRDHVLTVDMDAASGGLDEGPAPHDLYDSALAACKALTSLWYAQRKGYPLGDIEVTVERDTSQERGGVYALATTVRYGGDLTEAQRVELLGVAQKCPIHKLMTEVETRITTTLVE